LARNASVFARRRTDDGRYYLILPLPFAAGWWLYHPPILTMRTITGSPSFSGAPSLFPSLPWASLVFCAHGCPASWLPPELFHVAASFHACAYCLYLLLYLLLPVSHPLLSFKLSSTVLVCILLCGGSLHRTWPHKVHGAAATAPLLPSTPRRADQFMWRFLSFVVQQALRILGGTDCVSCVLYAALFYFSGFFAWLLRRLLRWFLSFLLYGRLRPAIIIRSLCTHRSLLFYRGDLLRTRDRAGWRYGVLCLFSLRAWRILRDLRAERTARHGLIASCVSLCRWQRACPMPFCSACLLAFTHAVLRYLPIWPPMGGIFSGLYGTTIPPIVTTSAILVGRMSACYSFCGFGWKPCRGWRVRG